MSLLLTSSQSNTTDPSGCSKTECISILNNKIIGFDDTNNNCVECNSDRTKDNTGKCEKGCGADIECDERQNGPFIAGICSGCTFSGFKCGYVDDTYAIVCGNIPSNFAPEDVGKRYELRIQRKDNSDCGNSMSGFELSYLKGEGYLITRGLTTKINKSQLNADKQIKDCKFDVEFRII